MSLPADTSRQRQT